MDALAPTAEKRMIMAICKLGEKGCRKDGKCHYGHDCENKVLSNSDRIRAMSDEELSEFLCSILSKTRGGCSECVAADYCYPGHTGMIDYLKEAYDGKTDI